MLIKFHGILKEQYADIELEAKDIRDVFSLLKLNYGEELTSKLLIEKFAYIVQESENSDGILLAQEVLLSDLSSFTVLHIIPEIEGDVTAVGLAAAVGVTLTASSGLLITAAFYAAAFIINIGISLALSYLMSKLSPTPSMNKDPAMVQASQRQDTQRNTSNLFSSSTIVREQGCAVPLIFGQPYHGGVLIASGLYTEDR